MNCVYDTMYAVLFPYNPKLYCMHGKPGPVVASLFPLAAARLPGCLRLLAWSSPGLDSHEPGARSLLYGDEVCA